MKKLLYIYLFCIVFTHTGLAQTASDRQIIIANSNIERLKQLSSEYHQSFNQNKSASIQKKIITNKRGEKGYFSGFDNKGNPVYSFNENNNAAKSSRIDRIWLGDTLGLNLDGSDIQIGHWEPSGIARRHHQELEGRIFRGDTAFTSSHATHTACTMIGSGVNLLAKGMASGATILAYDVENVQSELVDFAIQGGILSNHSYRKGDPDGVYERYGMYTNDAAEWDEILYNAPYLLICKSAGNDGNDEVNEYDDGYDILVSVAVSKNLLTIGAVDDVEEYRLPNLVKTAEYSSFGPSDDWRIKPDIMANGVDVFSADGDANDDYDEKSGTSMASAVTTGTIALLQQHYHNYNNIYMKSATAKALVIASADELGESDGPDFKQGWGLLNAERAAEIISNNGRSAVIQELSLYNNNTYSAEIEVDGSTPVSITMAWTDPAGTYLGGYDNQNPMLVNDLDVRLLGNEKTYYPWVLEPDPYSKNFEDAAEKGDNYRDNIEKIDIKEIPAGKYTVLVTHKGELKNDMQDFSLVINGVIGTLVSSNHITKLDDISVFPNPVSNNELNISFPTKDGTSQFSLQLYNSQGQILRNKTYYNNNIRHNTSDLSKGIYFIKLTRQHQVYTKQVIIN